MQTSTILVVLASVLVAAFAAPGIEHDHYAYPKYKYTYAVDDKHTGDHKNAYEYRDGDVTKGSYSVLQPDGVLRTVNYIVDPKGGFQAQVLNKGVAHHGHGGGYGGGAGFGGAGAGFGGAGVGAGFGGAGFL